MANMLQAAPTHKGKEQEALLFLLETDMYVIGPFRFKYVSGASNIRRSDVWHKFLLPLFINR